MNVAVFSTNSNHDYDFFAPIVAWAWKQFGWQPCVIVDFEAGKTAETVLRYLQQSEAAVLVMPKVEGLHPVTAIQTARAYVPIIFPDDYVMTTDVDMIPLSDFWPKDGSRRITGWDITGFPHPNAQVPVCYVAATGLDWGRIMGVREGQDWVSAMIEGLKEIEGGMTGRWDADQELITKRVRSFGDKHFNKVERYARTGMGRVCRSSWHEGTQRLNFKPQVDCHALRPGYTDAHWPEIVWVLRKAGVYADWMEEYRTMYLASRAQ